MSTPFVLLLNGHPGAGKTTVANELRNKCPRLAILDVDLFRKFVSDYNRSPKDIKLMWSVTAALIDVYLSNGISILLDRCIDEQKDRNFLHKIAKKHSVVLKEVILYTKTLKCAVDRVNTRPIKPLSKNSKTQIDKRLIARLRKSIIEDGKQLSLVMIDTEVDKIETVTQSVIKLMEYYGHV